MNYIPFEDYKRKWIFTHQSMPVAEEDRAEIKPMSEDRGAQAWRDFVSKQSPTPDHFGKGDWAIMSSVWEIEDNWMNPWEEEADLPESVTAFFNMEDNGVVYFCYDKNNVIETRWGTFRKYWKNFLFYDDKPLLISKKKKEVAMFEQSGVVKLGKRP
ncbi:hypothetical protein BCT30_07020 [Enterovibrio norvegicus]|uniref:DUF2947 domain-containing protein n=2 Tax=Enterovibrio norvegicus TaxID=188144 RepID=A0A1I5XAT2_9GAMM|nr:DUF2947 domain-containing protein [Enterovibrio norvegicus]MCC4797187.1 DUF2947 domain-containing protein [Enterovibrio norvegicus]OEF58248.1 hypothetical protein A1OU_08635 [Enterovibrio norvegicus]PMI26921.1 hypothetical protein BCU47_02945 [Enterovibrio norvegicus]PMI35323.1 hypothetical protein BCU46_18730 [Enterovibrio norvegicus]PMN56202.1 hypothetical protein BCT30_07020 [Enterovibrio norvegicus]